jgi:hypothetical protein
MIKIHHDVICDFCGTENSILMTQLSGICEKCGKSFSIYEKAILVGKRKRQKRKANRNGSHVLSMERLRCSRKRIQREKNRRHINAMNCIANIILLLDISKLVESGVHCDTMNDMDSLN